MKVDPITLNQLVVGSNPTGVTKAKRAAPDEGAARFVSSRREDRYRSDCLLSTPPHVTAILYHALLLG